MSECSPTAEPDWLAKAAAWLTPKRLRAQAIVLALCLWGVCVVDYARPGLFDRAGNIKFQDFLQFSVAAQLVAQGRAAELYDERVLLAAILSMTRAETASPETTVRLQYFYGPQVALPFVPFARLSFLTQAEIWVALSLVAYFACVYRLWKVCGDLRPYGGMVLLSAIAYPPLFHFFVRGQLSVAVLVCFTASCLAFLSHRDGLAGLALGLLAFKPQFLVAIPLVLLLARSWRMFAGVIISAAAQLVFTVVWFGSSVMRSYIAMLLHSASQPTSTELSLSPIQMHSLRSFWALLIPWPRGVWVLYLVSSLAVIAIAAAIWKSSSPRSLRFCALILAAVLVNPHNYIYDLLALVPVFFLVAGWILANPQNRISASLKVFLYLAFILPLFGPLCRWTHLQLSVPAFAALLWVLWCGSPSAASAGESAHKLAPGESRVV